MKNKNLPLMFLEKSKNKIIDDNEQEDPLRVIKLRLAKGEIDKKEYQELYNAISS